jgi:hypothetical protein
MADETVGGEMIAGGFNPDYAATAAEYYDLRVRFTKVDEELARVTALLVGMQRAPLAEGEAPSEVLERFMVEADRQAKAAEERLSTLTGELTFGRLRLAAQKGSATRARGEAAALKLELSPKARKVGRPAGRFGRPAEPFDPALARLAIDDGEVEIVFSDGKAEIIALAPRSVGGDAWQRGSRGYRLLPPIDLEPGEMDAPQVEIAGFGILAAGEQVGWQELPEPIVVRSNSRVLLENVIII